MNKFLKLNWNKFKGTLKQRYPQLTMKDLEYKDGKAEEFLMNLSNKTRMTKEALIKEIKSY